MKLKQKLQKAGSLLFAALAVLTLCLHPIKQAESSYEPGVRVCNVDDDPVELPLNPRPPKPH